MYESDIQTGLIILDKTEYRKNAYLLIYLIGCVLTDKIPESEKIYGADLSALFTISKAHSLTAITASAISKANIHDKAFEEEKYQNIRKNIIFDAERQRVLEALEKTGIWHTPLKGCIIKDMYPDMSMRQMADNDILCDSTHMKDVRSIMERLGFTTVSFGTSHQDVYNKQPVCSFEMHSHLLEPRHGDKLYDYYSKIKNKLIKDDDSGYGYHFSDEDFYIYFVAHEYKHFAVAGTGLRSLADTYVILCKLWDELDKNYIFHECKKIGIADFEAQNRQLSFKIFAGEDIDESEREFLDRYIFAGTYGSMETRVNNADTHDLISKIKYAYSRIKLPEQTLKEFHPFYYKYKAARPILYIRRLILKAAYDKNALQSEIRALIGVKDRKISRNAFLKGVASKIGASPFGNVFKTLYDLLIVAEYHILCIIWSIDSPHITIQQRKHIAENVTFIYKSFERQYMAKRLFRSIQKYSPGAKVIIADDSSKPLKIRSPYVRIIQLPFDSGLSYGLNRALAAVDTPYTFRMDDDELITPLSKIYEQLRFLEKHKNIDLVGIQACSAPFPEKPAEKAKVYYKFNMRNAPKKFIIPHKTKIDKDHIVVGKVSNIFLIRTEKYRNIGYDDNIKRIDHHEFFYRAAGNIVSVMDTSAFVYHYHNWFDGHYKKFRNDTSGDTEYIRKKHGERYYK